MKRQEGFTLIELMVVILIIGILVAIAVPVFFSARTSARKGACLDNMRTIDSSIMTFYADSEGWPDAGILTNTAYLKKEPICPYAALTYAWQTPAADEAPYVTCPNVGEPDCADHVL